MFTRLVQARKEEEGFTLIELLVVIIIIGILAAIAIPVFLNQRKKGWESAVKADLRNAATAEETVLTDSGSYTNKIADLQAVGGFIGCGFEMQAFEHVLLCQARKHIRVDQFGEDNVVRIDLWNLERACCRQQGSGGHGVDVVAVSEEGGDGSECVLLGGQSGEQFRCRGTEGFGK